MTSDGKDADRRERNRKSAEASRRKRERCNDNRILIRYNSWKKTSSC